MQTVFISLQVAKWQRNAPPALRYSLEIIVSIYNMKATVSSFRRILDNVTMNVEPWARDLLTFDIGKLLAPNPVGLYDRDHGYILDLVSFHFDKDNTPYQLPSGIVIRTANDARTLFGEIKTSSMFGATGAEVCFQLLRWGSCNSK